MYGTRLRFSLAAVPRPSKNKTSNQIRARTNYRLSNSANRTSSCVETAADNKKNRVEGKWGARLLPTPRPPIIIRLPRHVFVLPSITTK